MKKLVFIFSALFITILINAQPPSGKAKPGTTYGSKVNPDNAIEAKQLPVLLEANDTVTVRVKALVKEVCSQKGCWMTFKVNDTTEAFVKMKGYGFFVPMDLANKTVILDGKSFIKTTSVSELKHYAEDAKKSKSEINAITKPKEEIRFIANGILVM